MATVVPDAAPVVAGAQQTGFILGGKTLGTVTITSHIVKADGTTLPDATDAIDIIAGWDGTTSLAGVLGSSLSSGTFGRSGGDVTLASPVANKVSAGNKIAVGSAQGTTTVDAENLR